MGGADHVENRAVGSLGGPHQDGDVMTEDVPGVEGRQGLLRGGGVGAVGRAWPGGFPILGGRRCLALRGFSTSSLSFQAQHSN